MGEVHGFQGGAYPQGAVTAMRVGSLFSGIGGMDLGLERAGMEICWMSEIEPFACKVLSSHWPNVPNLGNVNSVSFPPPVDLICGGFPCTDLSNCRYGSHQGLDGQYSGLFFEMSRIVREVRPSWVVMENVPKVLQFLDVVRQHMPGYELQGEVFNAADFGVWTRRRRAFVVGYLGAGRVGQVFDKLKVRRAAVPARGDEDILPMCLPWKGGPSLKRLSSCLVEDTEADSTRMREGDGLSGRLDGRRYLAIGNAVCPSMAKIVGECIMESCHVG